MRRNDGTSTESLADRIEDTHIEHPDWEISQIARKVGATSEYVRVTKRRRRLPIPRDPAYSPSTALRFEIKPLVVEMIAFGDAMAELLGAAAEVYDPEGRTREVRYRAAISNWNRAKSAFREKLGWIK